MFSHAIAGLAATLRARPDLAGSIAIRLEQIAADLADQEGALIPPHLQPPPVLPPGVANLSSYRRSA